MNVREQLETPAARSAPERDVGLEVFRRGRRRLRRRRVVTAGGAAAAAVVVGVLAWPGGMPGSGTVVVDDVVGAPDDSAEPDEGPDPDRHDRAEPDVETEPDEDEEPTAGPDTLAAPVQVAIGGVELTVPVDVRLRSQDAPVTTPCHPGTTAPTVHVLAAGIDPELPDCASQTATATSIVAAPASRMPPASLPGEGTPDAELDVAEVGLLGTTGTSETYVQRDGTEVTSYVFGELDLYLAVRGPELTPSLVDDLLESVERRGDDGSSVVAPTATDEAMIARFLRFASDPTAATAAELPFGDEVALGLADELLVTRSRTQLADPATWRLDAEDFRAYVGPFSALELAAGSSPTDTIVSLGEHPHCVSPPKQAPADLVNHRRVSVQPDPETVDSCLNWWTVDLYVADNDTITAVTLDLYEP